MWVVIPVKSFRKAKRRLACILTVEQRAKLSRLLLMDVLDTLCATRCVQGITVVGSDPSLRGVVRNPVELQLLGTDGGYSHDVAVALNDLTSSAIRRILIMPADMPAITSGEVECLEQTHPPGWTLCPAAVDGGTNAIVFTPPLAMPLQFGPSSFRRHLQAARDLGLDVNIVRLPGFARDIDRPDDLAWLGNQPTGALSWSYARRLLSEIPAPPVLDCDG